jgi:hypothetical protein
VSRTCVFFWVCVSSSFKCISVFIQNDFPEGILITFLIFLLSNIWLVFINLSLKPRIFFFQVPSYKSVSFFSRFFNRIIRPSFFLLKSSMSYVCCLFSFLNCVWPHNKFFTFYSTKKQKILQKKILYIKNLSSFSFKFLYIFLKRNLNGDKLKFSKKKFQWICCIFFRYKNTFVRGVVAQNISLFFSHCVCKYNKNDDCLDGF